MKYFYIKNQQGDVEKIVNKNGNVVVKYFYDDWGNLISMTDTTSSGYGIGSFNPYRYRGYIYDDETGLYYLRSRYYDPVTGRFINADSPAYTDTNSGTPLSTNMFAYCENNPVNNIDFDGCWYHKLREYKKFVNLLKGNYCNYYNIEKNFYLSVKERYKNNKNLIGSFCGYVFGQSDSRVANLTFGNNYTIRYNGCGLIALYNVMLNIGKRKPLPKIILEAELNNMLWFNGMFGTLDSGIASFLKNHKIKYKKYEQFDDYFKNKNKFRISIIYVTTSDGIRRHYFCILKRSNGTYVTLNRYSDQTNFEDIFKKDSDVLYFKKHFIRIFCIY